MAGSGAQLRSGQGGQDSGGVGGFKLRDRAARKRAEAEVRAVVKEHGLVATSRSVKPPSHRRHEYRRGRCNFRCS
jgi:hypothetical protein